MFEFLEVFGKLMHYQLFMVKQTSITVSSLFVFFTVLLVLIFLSNYISSVLRNKIFPNLRLDESSSYTFGRIVYYLLLMLSMVFSFQFIGVDLSSLLVVFGFLSVGIGFGLQNITSNFISGIILLIEQPIKVGDRVTVGNTEGDIIEINIRSTIVRSLENISIIVPNSEFVASQVINWSHGDKRIRLGIKVGVSYNSDLDTVLRALMEVAEENPNVLKDPEPFVRHLGFGDSSWNMFLGAWISNPSLYYQMLSDLNCSIIRKFRQNNIEIPFPQRDLHVRSPIPVPLQNITPLDTRDKSSNI